MKVLIINGSPRVNGNTSIAVNELVKTFEAEGVETVVSQIGNIVHFDPLGKNFQCQHGCQMHQHLFFPFFFQIAHVLWL